MRLSVLGATGRVGRLLVDTIESATDLALASAVSRTGARTPSGVTVIPLGPGCFDGAEVVVDFSLPDALDAALPWLGGRPLVTGTTGLTPAQEDDLRRYAAQAPVVAAANFSAGVTLLLDLVARAAAALPEYDCEIVEVHHARKRDAPSGTALALGRAAADARATPLASVARHGRRGHVAGRPPGEIGFHALRVGDVVGEHTVWLGALGEHLELRHVATSRATFVEGALRAARWSVDRPPGMYGMRDVLGL